MTCRLTFSDDRSAEIPLAQCQRVWACAGSWLVGLCCLAFFRAPATAAESTPAISWEFSAYQNTVWLALPETPPFLAAKLPEWSQKLAFQAELAMPSIWHLQTTAPPGFVQAKMQQNLESVTIDDILLANPKALGGDKLFLASINDDGLSFHVQVREVDSRMRLLGPVLSRDVPQESLLPYAVGDLLIEAFAPTARVEQVEDRKVNLRLRAAGLILDPDSPAQIQPGAVLRPVLRSESRTGDPGKNGIRQMPWTVLEVKELTESLLLCELNSGYRTPIPTKGNARLQRLAILAKPSLPATRVVLRSRGEKSQFLSGYEVYIREPGETEHRLLGVTDWRGSVEVPRQDTGLRVLYVKNGNQLLARLPLVPGYEAEAIATTLEDDSRLQAEGFVLAFQGRIMDLVARREILASRIRKRLVEAKEGTAGKTEEAAKLLENFRTLETRSDLKKDLDEQQQNITSRDKLTQARIDKLFGDANKLNNRFLDPEMSNQLAKELEAAKSSPPAAK